MAQARATKVIRSVLTAKLCIMNSYSPEQIAESLGTSRRRVVRAAEMSGVGRRVGSRTRFSGADRATLAKKLGVTPRVEGLSRIEAHWRALLHGAANGLRISCAILAESCPNAASFSC